MRGETGQYFFPSSLYTYPLILLQCRCCNSNIIKKRICEQWEEPARSVHQSERAFLPSLLLIGRRPARGRRLSQRKVLKSQQWRGGSESRMGKSTFQAKDMSDGSSDHFLVCTEVYPRGPEGVFNISKSYFLEQSCLAKSPTFQNLCLCFSLITRAATLPSGGLSRATFLVSVKII